MARYNPFNPNSIVTPTLFAGRTSQVLGIIEKLRYVAKGMPASFVLHGDRGIGKTALAKLIKHFAEANNPDFYNLKFLTSYYTVEKGQHFSSVLTSSLNQLTDKIPSPVLSRLTERLGSLFKNGKFTLGAFGVQAGFEAGDGDSKNTEQYLKDQAVSALTNILAGLKEQEGAACDGLLIIIDEIHNTTDIEGIAQILRSISTTLNVGDAGNVSFLIIGYSDPIAKFFAGDPSAKRLFDTIHLSYMPHGEAKEVLTKGFNEAGVRFDETELDKGIRVAGGYPHSIQVLGHNLIQVDKDDMIDKADWHAAHRETAIELKSKDFSNLYKFTGKPTLREQVLNLMALYGEPISKQKIAEELSGKNIYTKNCLGELKKSGAVHVDPDTEELSLQSGLFRTAILVHIIPKIDKDPTLSGFAKFFTA